MDESLETTGIILERLRPGWSVVIERDTLMFRVGLVVDGTAYAGMNRDLRVAAEDAFQAYKGAMNKNAT